MLRFSALRFLLVISPFYCIKERDASGFLDVRVRFVTKLSRQNRVFYKVLNMFVALWSAAG